MFSWVTFSCSAHLANPWYRDLSSVSGQNLMLTIFRYISRNHYFLHQNFAILDWQFFRNASKKILKKGFLSLSRGGQWVPILTYFSLLKNNFQAILDHKNFFMYSTPPPSQGSLKPPGVPMSILCGWHAMQCRSLYS